MPAASHRSTAADAGLAAAGAVVLAATAALASGEKPSAAEADVFAAVNDLADLPYAVVWPFLQLGSLAGALALAAAVALGRSRRGGVVTAAAAVTTWLLVKLAKAAAGRPRPSGLLDDVVLRGESPTGNGFPSAHAAVAAAAVAAAWPWLPAPWRAVAAVAAAVVAVARVYVGAHLPLDVLAGAGLGMALAGVARVVARRTG